MKEDKSCFIVWKLFLCFYTKFKLIGGQWAVLQIDLTKHKFCVNDGDDELVIITRVFCWLSTNLNLSWAFKHVDERVMKYGWKRSRRNLIQVEPSKPNPTTLLPDLSYMGFLIGQCCKLLMQTTNNVQQHTHEIKLRGKRNNVNNITNWGEMFNQ